MRSIQDVEAEIIAEFAALPGLDAKFTHLFELGQALPPFPVRLKTEANRVRGCQSELWFVLQEDGGRLHLQAESDSLMISGIAALLVRLVEGRRPEALAELSLDFLDALQLAKMSSRRNNGLQAMLDHIKTRARQTSAQVD
jgi:cysteine desulfuration protein SufE